MHYKNRPVQAAICYLLSVMLLATSLVSTTVSAQADYYAPTIELLTEPEGKAGSLHTFGATVLDNIGVTQVILFYRNSSEIEFNQKEMRKLAGTSYFSTRLRLLENSQQQLEYYLQAADAAGNVVLKGYAFDPYTVRILPSTPTNLQNVEPAASPAAVTETTPESKPQRKIVYILGTLALLALVGLAASGGGSSNGPESPRQECTGSGCNVQLMLNPP